MKKLFIFFIVCAAAAAQQTKAQVFIKDSATLVLPGKIITPTGALNFIAMGDWGRVGEDHQKQVAEQMGKTAAEVKSQFTIAVGDNFYPSGVVSEWDPLWKYSYEDIYTAFSLQWDWYPVLGNHDYKTNPDAQVRYSKISRRWKMPARYYSKLISIPGDTASKILFLFIDTNPLIPEFYSNPEYGPNVKTADSAAQKKWIAAQLKAAASDKNIKWKMVVGHHPMFTGGSRTDGYDTRAIRRTLKPLFDQYGVDVFLTGHEHSLQHLIAGGKTQHFITGSASERTPVHVIPEAKMLASEYGFMVFTVTANQITVNTIDYTGKIIYSTTISK